MSSTSTKKPFDWNANIFSYTIGTDLFSGFVIAEKRYKPFVLGELWVVRTSESFMAKDGKWSHRNDINMFDWYKFEFSSKEEALEMYLKHKG